MADTDYDKTRRLAEQAQVDAQLAKAKAQSENARREMQQTRQAIEALRRKAETGDRTSSGGIVMSREDYSRHHAVAIRCFSLDIIAMRSG